MAEQITLPITGMTCANCVATVEKGLRKLDGVQEVSVNLATERASITFDPAKLDKTRLIDRIKLVGYGVVEAADEEMEDAERAARQAEVEHQQRLLLIGAIFTIPLFLLSMLRDLNLLGTWA